jgi:protein TonB
MDLSDIVFENRNKDYGAYYLRKRYVRHLLISFSIVLFLVLLFAGYSVAYKFFSFKPVSMPRGVVYEPTYLSEEDIVAPELPEKKQEEPLVEELNESPVVSDSVQNTAKKEIEKEEELKEENEEMQDSSSGGGRQGVADGEIIVPIQRMPEFPGGESALASFIQKNFRLNAISRSQRVRGIVVVSFKVLRDGRLGDIKVVRSLTPELDQECIRVVSIMPLWRPAVSGGRAIDLTHNLPFTVAY